VLSNQSIGTFLQHNKTRATLSILSLLMLVLAACGGTSTGNTGTATPAAKGSISVLYAGSLVNMMQNQIDPGFKQDTGYTVQGESAGSSALANEIKGKLRRPDIFISADPNVNKTLMGSANGNYVSWYTTFSRTSMVLGYSPKSKYAADFKEAAAGKMPWYQVLEEPGIRIGRTDPLLDPKGYYTIILTELAEKYYNQPGLTQKLLGTDENTKQIFPEQDMVSRLGSGQLDAGFFYLNEVKAANIPYITLPDQINLSDPALNSTYAQATYTNTQTHQVDHGGAITYSITIPSTSQNKAGAIAFVDYMLSAKGQSFLTQDGMLTTTPQLSGDKSAVPSQLQKYFQ
jgi:molybdate/tungstate transport system substrate-binding protein